jgi:starch synthase
MYSLRYGTVPVVRQTGGLADTIVDATELALAAGTATGFSFVEDSPAALSETLRRAVEAYRRPEVWSRLIATGMRQDWSWATSAKRYETLYRETAARTGRGKG